MDRPRILPTLLLAVLLAPCVSAKGGTEAPSSQGPVAIKVLFSHANNPYGKNMTDWKNDIYAKEMNRLSGYSIEWEFGPHTEWAQFLAVRFASGDLPDIVRTDSVDSVIHPGAVDSGVFTEVGPLVEKYGSSIKKNILPGLWDSPMVSKNGKIYAIPVMAPYAATRVVYYRQDWLDKAGMAVPRTLDDCLKFYDWVKTADANGNGDPNDEYGFFVRENLNYSELFFGSYGVYPALWRFTDGRLVPQMILPEMKEPLRFWKALFDKGYINPNLFTNKAGDWTAGIYNSKGGSWLHDVGNYEVSWVNQILDKSARLTMAEAPQGPKGDKGLFPAGTRFHFSMVFPVKSKVNVDAVKFIDKCWGDPALESFFLWGIKDRNYTLDASGKVQYDSENPNNKTDNQFNIYRMLMNPTVYNTNTPKVLAIRPNAQVYMDGNAKAAVNAIQDPAPYLPTLEAFKTAPELRPGFYTGGLFLDMFAAVVTGRKDLDTAFDAFVAEWKKRGGDDAIKQATDWYNRTQKK